MIELGFLKESVLRANNKIVSKKQNRKTLFEIITFNTCSTRIENHALL
jgi:hypothetical protein